MKFEGYGILGHAKLLAQRQRNPVNFVIHNLPVIHKMQNIAKACGNTFGLMQGNAPEISGGLLIALPREQVCIVNLIEYPPLSLMFLGREILCRVAKTRRSSSLDCWNSRTGSKRCKSYWSAKDYWSYYWRWWICSGEFWFQFRAARE